MKRMLTGLPTGCIFSTGGTVTVKEDGLSGFERLIREKIVIFDGGMGTSLLESGISPDDFQGHTEVIEFLALSRPDIVKTVHASFLQAGADVIETNTFCASPLSLLEHGLKDSAREINFQAARLARCVAGDFSGTKLVAGSVGPTSFLPTLDHISFNELISCYKVQIEALIEGGCDLLIFETCQDILQIKAAVAAAEASMKKLGKPLPIMVQFTIDEKGRTLLGSEPETLLCLLESLAVTTIGLNCGVGPAGMVEGVRTLSRLSSRPISCQPNAGLPEIVEGNTVFTLEPTVFAKKLAFLAREAGLNIAGGCCGTRPEHIFALASELNDIPPRIPSKRYPGSISSLYRVVGLNIHPGPLLVAEEMNATTKKKGFRSIVQTHDEDKLLAKAKKLEDEGAQVLDLCVATVDGNEAKDMAWAVTSLRKTIKTPLFIDTTDPEVIEAAGHTWPGKFVVNSVNLEKGPDHFYQALEMARRFGGAVIAMTLDEEGIAVDRERKLTIADRMYSLAVKSGCLCEHDLIFDPLTLPLGTGSADLETSAVATLETLKLVKSRYPNCLTVLGVSNVSFGLSKKARRVLNSVFLWEAVEAGLDIAIISRSKLLRPDQISPADKELALNLIYHKSGTDGDPLLVFSRSFTTGNGGKPEHFKDTSVPADLSPRERLRQAVLSGTADKFENDIEQCLETMKSDEVLNDIFLEAMSRVGDFFEEGKLQLPSVLASAEVIKKAFDFLREHFDGEPETFSPQSRGTIVLGTVKGDVHDIGKNLVDMVLTSSGYSVFNLGIKQTSRQIMEAAVKHDTDVVGLSGLLTKSVMEMEQVLRDFRRAGVSKPFILGGAALRRNHVEGKLRTIYGGPVYYAKDAMEGLRIMQTITGPETGTDFLKDGSRPREIEASSSSHRLPSTTENTSVDEFLKEIPTPPFFGREIVVSADLTEATNFLDEKHLFRFHWKISGGNRKQNEEAAKILEGMKKQAFQNELVTAGAVYGYFRCLSKGNKLRVFDKTSNSPPVEFSFPPSDTGLRTSPPGLFLSEKHAPEKKYDLLPVFVVTVGHRAAQFLDELQQSDRYIDYLRWHGFFAQTTEALAAYMQSRIERDIAGSNKGVTTWQRLSFGYPACPDLENQKLLFELLAPQEAIGVTLTETFQMIPEHSVSAFMVRKDTA